MDGRYDNIEYDFDFDNYTEPVKNETSSGSGKNSEKENIKSNKKSRNTLSDNKYLLLIIQFVVCTLLALGAYILKLTDSDAYRRIRAMYYDNINLSLITTQEDDRTLSQRLGAENESLGVSALRYIDADDELVTDVYGMMNNLRKNPAQNTDTMVKALPTYKISDGRPKLSEYLLAPLDKGVFTSYFGGRPDPTTGVWVNHYGVDIAADEGENIYAVMAGDVDVAEKSDSYGNYVVINHGNDIKTLYAHCSKLYVKEGQHVEKGEIIAAVGSTGDSTGNHLHFEIRIKDVCYDPYDLIERFYA